jgi:aspartate-semialdehyde dehydrogenase
VATIKRIVVSTYQAVSGKGKDAVEELKTQSGAVLQNQKISTGVFPHQIAFNEFPDIDKFHTDGNTFEEIKMVNETRKIMELPNLPVSATCVRVPVYTSHSVSLNLEFEKPLGVEPARQILSEAPGVVLMDNPQDELYPTPVFAAGRDEVFVGRIRKDNSVEHGLNLWVVSDNLRKGAALNTIQIAEELIKE